MKRVVLGVPCVRRLDLLQDLYRSAALGSLPPDLFAIVDNGADVRKVFNEEADASIPFAVFGDGKTNSGVSASWNLLFETYGDAHIIISNDDVRLHENTVKAMVDAAEQSDSEFVFPATPTHTTFCVFLLKVETWLRVGKFDEGFWPAYYEDIDYWHRMRHAGVKMQELTNTAYDHVLNGYLKAMSPTENARFHKYMQANYRRYVRKWGGGPGRETRKTPLILP